MAKARRTCFVGLALSVFLAGPVLGQTIPKELLDELQGRWVSRFEGDVVEIEVNGADVRYIVPPVYNYPAGVPELGRWMPKAGEVFYTFAAVRFSRPATNVLPGKVARTDFGFNGFCTSYHGGFWKRTEKPDCQGSVSTWLGGGTSDLMGRRNWEYDYRGLAILSHSFIRPTIKAKWFPKAKPKGKRP